MKRFVALCGGVLLVPGVLFATVSQSAQLPPWEGLSAEQRRVWTEVVSQAFSGTEEPEENYRLRRAIVAEHGAEGAASPYPVERLMELEIASRVFSRRLLDSMDEPSSDTLREWTAQREKGFPPVKRIALQSIHVRRHEGESTATVKARADEARAALDRGMSFGRAAALYSDARSAGRGGTVGSISPGMIAPELEALLFGQDEGSTIGPVEGAGGYHIFHVAKVTPAFDLNNAGDYQRAREMWRTQQAAGVVERLVTAWEAETSPTVAQRPRNESDWTGETWIEHGGRRETFGLGFLAVASRDSQTTEPGQWSAFWEEELLAQARQLTAQLAVRDSVADDALLSRALELALPMARGREGLRQWFVEQRPSEAELAAYFEEKGQELFPPQPLYTYLQWDAPVTSVAVSQAQDRAPQGATREAIQAGLNAVFKAVAELERPKSPEEAERLFADLSRRFEGARVTSATKAHAKSPIVDPILFRTGEGELSRPFDNVNSVGLVYMIEKTTDTATLERVRPQAELQWRLDRMGEHLERLRGRASAD